MPGKNETLSVKEQAALGQFKKRLADLDLENYPVLEDRRLIHWLRARDLKLDDAEDMLRKHLAWRKENDIDTILTSNTISEEAKAAVPVEVNGVDKEGNTLLLFHAGPLDIRGCLDKYGKSVGIQILHLYLQTAYEDIVKNSTDPNVLRGCVYILDVEGVRYKDYLASDAIDLLASCLKCVEANYPEVLDRAYVLNAPAIFTVMYNMFKPFISAKTQSKVNILGCDQEKIRQKLLETIPESQLPRKWGGTNLSKKIMTLNIASSAFENKEENWSNGDCVEVVVPAGDLLEIKFDVEAPKALISWSFKTKSYDIGFALLHRPSVLSDDLEKSKEIIGYKRLNSHKAVQSGSVMCDSCGQYILRFDNTYSRLREKSLKYQVDISHLTLNGNNYYER